MCLFDGQHETEVHLRAIWCQITTKSMPVLTVVIVFGHCFCVESSVRNSVITSEDLVEGRSWLVGHGHVSTHSGFTIQKLWSRSLSLHGIGLFCRQRVLLLSTDGIVLQAQGYHPQCESFSCCCHLWLFPHLGLLFPWLSVAWCQGK